MSSLHRFCRLKPAALAAGSWHLRNERQTVPVSDTAGRFGSWRLMSFPLRAAAPWGSRYVQCMQPVASPSDELVYTTLRDIYNAIPDTDVVTLKDLRGSVSDRLGFGLGGLEGKRDMIRMMADQVINDRPMLEFQDGALVESSANSEAVVPIALKTALAATSGLRLRKLPKPRFVPLCPPVVDLADLNLKDFNRCSPVKHVVDVVVNYHYHLEESDIKQAVIEGDTEALPPVARPPIAAVAVNHFQQMAFIPVNKSGPPNGVWLVVKHLTFCSDGAGGKVTCALAARHKHGELYTINYGTNIQNGKRVFQRLRAVGWHPDSPLGVANWPQCFLRGVCGRRGGGH